MNFSGLFTMALLAVFLAAVPSGLEAEERAADRGPASPGNLLVAVSGFKNLSDSDSYYSKIITDSLYNNMKNSQGLEPLKVSYLPGIILNPNRESIEGIVPDFANYLITGEYITTSDSEMQPSISITLQIINLSNMKSVTETLKSEELGATFSDTAAVLQISVLNAISRLSAESTPSAHRPSPYSTAYKGLSGLTLGVEYGYLYLLGDWPKIYNNTKSSRSSISGYSDIFGISLNVEYISMNNDGMKNRSSLLSLFSYIGTLHTAAGIMLGDHFRFDLFAGGGLNYTNIKTISSYAEGNPFIIPESETRSYDPCFEGGVRINMMAGGLVLSSSAFYRHIFFTGTPMKSYLLTLGVGYML